MGEIGLSHTILGRWTLLKLEAVMKFVECGHLDLWGQKCWIKKSQNRSQKIGVGEIGLSPTILGRWR